jgi:hypothetical protein
MTERLPQQCWKVCQLTQEAAHNAPFKARKGWRIPCDKAKRRPAGRLFGPRGLDSVPAGDQGFN